MMLSVRSLCVFGCISILAMVVAARAQAAPARVRVFEAPVHERPDGNSKRLKMLEEDAEVSVSEEVTDGWRRVRLSDGRVGWVQDRNLRLLGDEESAPSSADDAAGPPPTPPPVAPFRPNQTSSRPFPARSFASDSPPVSIYVKDLDHLAELTRPDPVVFSMASKLATRQTTGKILLWGGGIAGGLIALGSFSVFASEECTDYSTPSYPSAPICSKRVNSTALLVGGLIACAGLLMWPIMRPSREELLDVINTWNGRHPRSQFSLEHEVSQR